MEWSNNMGWNEINGSRWFLILGWWFLPTPNRLTASLYPPVLMTLWAFHREFWPLDSLLNASTQWLSVLPPDINFYVMVSTSISPWTFQRCYPSWSFTFKLKPPKISLLPLLVENFQITSGYLSLWPYALFAKVVLQPSPWLISSNVSTNLYTPCTTLCFNYTSIDMRTTISLLVFLK